MILGVNDKGRFIREQTAQWRCLLQQRQFGRGPGFGLQRNGSLVTAFGCF